MPPGLKSGLLWISTLLLFAACEASTDGLQTVPSGPSIFEKPEAVSIVVYTGQSLSVGTQGIGAIQTATLSYGYQLSRAGDALIPLAEGTPLPDRETGATSMAIRMRARGAGDIHVIRGGVGATTIEERRADPGTFRDIMNAIATTRDLHRAAGRDVVVRFWIEVGGESDQAAGVSDIADQLEQTRVTAETEIRVITGQMAPLEMFVSQVSSSAQTVGGTNVALQQLEAAKTHPHIHFVTAKYHHTYSEDRLHLTAADYERMGAEIGEALGRFFWSPTLWGAGLPLSVTGGANAQIDLRYDVPTPPLVVDTTTVSTRTAHGYELGGNLISNEFITIDAVSVDGSTVRLELSEPIGPTSWSGSPKPRVKYAFSGGTGYVGGRLFSDSPAGNVRDSGAVACWLPHHDEEVTSGGELAPDHTMIRSLNMTDGNEQITIPYDASMNVGSEGYWSIVLRLEDAGEARGWIWRYNQTSRSARWNGRMAKGTISFNFGTASIQARNLTALFDDGGFHHVLLVYEGDRAVNEDRADVFIDGIRWPKVVSGTIPRALPVHADQPYHIGNTSGGLPMHAGHFALGAAAPTPPQLWRSGLVRSAVDPLGSVGGLPEAFFFLRPNDSDDPGKARGIVNHGTSGSGLDASATNMTSGDVVSFAP